jgi:hypothetical protein
MKMNCDEWREQLREWLSSHNMDDNFRCSVPDTLTKHAETCKDCGIRLKSTLMLFQNTGFREDKAPDGLSEKITAYILSKANDKKHRRLSWVFIPLAAAALVIITFFFTLAFFTRTPDMITIHLMINMPEATTVSVVGDWNSWNPEADILSDTDGDGVWEIRIKLNKNNEYRYQFLINGKEWVPDPSSPLQVDDGFGGINSILEI